MKFREETEDLLKKNVAVHGTLLTWCLQWVSQSHITASPAFSIQIDGVQSSVGLHLQSTWGKDILYEDPYKEMWRNLLGAANKQRVLNWCVNVWTCQKDLSIQVKVTAVEDGLPWWNTAGLERRVSVELLTDIFRKLIQLTKQNQESRHIAWPWPPLKHSNHK